MIRIINKIYLPVIFLLSVSTAFGQANKGMSAEDALKKLIEGNNRFTASNALHPNQNAQRIKETGKGQNPFAVIVSCSDSRVPPEIIFDQGIGDLFIVRVAGNIVDSHALGSIEYAVEHLGANLVVVLGHERCGAVDAAVKGGEAHGHIAGIVKAIAPSVKKSKNEKGDLLENSIRNNAEETARIIKTSKPILEHLVKEGRLTVIPARYDLDDGKVEFMVK